MKGYTRIFVGVAVALAAPFAVGAAYWVSFGAVASWLIASDFLLEAWKYLALFLANAAGLCGVFMLVRTIRRRWIAAALYVPICSFALYFLALYLFFAQLNHWLARESTNSRSADPANKLITLQGDRRPP